MATVTQTFPTSAFEETAYAITSDVYTQMVEQGMIPADRHVFLWDGRLYEKMAKTKAHAAVHNAFNQALTRRLPRGLFVGNENPVRLDEIHIPLPDLVVLRGEPLDYFDTHYPGGRSVLLVVEIAVSSLPDDLGVRLARYARALPLATYIVADIPHRQVLVYSQPHAEDELGPGHYAHETIVRLGEAIHLTLDGVVLEPIPYEEVMPCDRALHGGGQAL